MVDWKRIKEAAERIQREVIVIDGDDTYVIMPFNIYDQLIDQRIPLAEMSEEQFLNEINRQIAEWRATQDDETPDPRDDQGKSSFSEEKYYIEPVEDEG